MYLRKYKVQVQHPMTVDPVGATPRTIELGNFPMCGMRGLYEPMGLVVVKLRITMLSKKKKNHVSNSLKVSFLP